MKKNKRIFRSFTLLEIIVAVGIFMVLLGLLLQFFSGARKLMVDSDYKNTLTANARTAMNLMAMTLQSIVYEPGRNPLHINYDGDNDELVFLTKYPLKSDDDSDTLYCVRYRWIDDSAETDDKKLGRLMLSFAGPSANSSNYADIIYIPKNSSYGNFIDDVKDELDGVSDPKEQKVISGVTDFKASFVYRDPNNMGDVFIPQNLADMPGSSTLINYLPLAVELRLSVMSPQAYKQWREMANGDEKDYFRWAHEESFTRLIYLGDRNLREKQQ